MSDAENTTVAPPVQHLLHRMTLLLQVHHELEGAEVHSISTAVSRIVEASCEPFSRRIQVDGTPKPLSLGWLEDEDCVGLIVLENLKTARQTNPTPAEIEEDAARLLNVVVGEQTFIVRPGWPMVFECLNPKGIMLRCVRGATYVKVTVFPR